MAQGEKKTRTTDFADERFKYVGFEVYPGKIGDIFSSDDERKSLISRVMAKFNRSDGEVRDRCTLIEERISKGERKFLAVLAVLMIISIFLPWFSGYHEIIKEKQVPAVGQTVTSEENASSTGEATETEPQMVTVTEVTHLSRSLSGIGAIFSIGNYGGKVFSSGFVLVITGLLFILYFFSCLGLALFDLHILYRVKMPDPDAYVLYLKKMLRYNWLPVWLWLGMFILSFFGASYGFNTKDALKQVGDSYGVSAFIGLSAFGIYIPFCAALLMALKGKEI